MESGEANLGTLVWSPPGPRRTSWSIGVADRSCAEFKLGDRPRAYALFRHVPPNLTYRVGVSRPSEDWYYAQIGVGRWTILFDLARPCSGTAWLTVAIAGATHRPVVQVRVNDRPIGEFPRLHDGSLYRSSNVGGRYYRAEFAFPASLLRTGTNSLVFDMVRCAGPPSPGGVAYDIVKLEVEDATMAPPTEPAAQRAAQGEASGAAGSG